MRAKLWGSVVSRFTAYCSLLNLFLLLCCWPLIHVSMYKVYVYTKTSVLKNAYLYSYVLLNCEFLIPGYIKSSQFSSSLYHFIVVATV